MKKSFKTFLNENGFPFYYVYDENKEDIFGHTKKDKLDASEREHEDDEETKEKKTVDKLSSYLSYAKVIND